MIPADKAAPTGQAAQSGSLSCHSIRPSSSSAIQWLQITQGLLIVVEFVLVLVLDDIKDVVLELELDEVLDELEDDAVLESEELADPVEL